MDEVLSGRCSRKINSTKTEFTICGWSESTDKNIKLRGETLQIVSEFTCLNNNISNDGRNERYICRFNYTNIIFIKIKQENGDT